MARPDAQDDDEEEVDEIVLVSCIKEFSIRKRCSLHQESLVTSFAKSNRSQLQAIFLPLIATQRLGLFEKNSQKNFSLVIDSLVTSFG